MSHLRFCRKNLRLPSWRGNAIRCFGTTAPNTPEFPKTASTVIIGGGITGTSTAYHLAKKGAKNVVLLEKTELTAGSTWHAAGLTTLYNGGINTKRLHWDSMNLYSILEEEVDQEITLRKPGSIRLAFSKERVGEFKRQMTRAGWQDAPQQLLTPSEIKEKVPFIKTDNLLLGLYTPYDGHVDPYSLTQALAKASRKYGAQIMQGTTVNSLKLLGDNKWLIGTDRGHITADRIVNAAGFWANDVAKLAGQWLPAIATHHQYLITSPIPEIAEQSSEMTVLRHMEGSSYIRQEKQGLLLGSYEDPSLVQVQEEWARNGVPSTFGRELFPSDIDRMMACFSRVMEDIPLLEKASIKSIVNGPITYSPDGLPMIGPDELPNMWTLAAFGFGIIHGGGAGKYISDWILNGEPPYELVECDPLRFKPYANEKYLIEKAKEAYGRSNRVAYSNDELFGGRPTERLSTAYTKQKERRAYMNFHSGWEQPAWFALPGQKPEYIPTFGRGNWHEPCRMESIGVTTRAGIIDLTPFAKIIVEGPQATDFLDYMTANKVPNVGRTVLSHMLTPTAKVYAELTITQTEPNKFFIITGSGSELHDLRWLKNHARNGNWNVQIRNVTDDFGCLSVAGKKAQKVMETVNPRFKEDFKFLTAERLTLGDIETLAIKISYTGEEGWEFYHPRDQTGRLYEMLLENGSNEDIVDFGTITLNKLRLEKGYRMWGAEINKDRNLVEAGLTSFVGKNKKNFIGMEAHRKLEKEVPKERLVMAVVESDAESEPRGDESCWLAGKYVGKTTSGCYSFLLDKQLMFCYLPPVLTSPGIKFEVDLDCGRHQATVIKGSPALSYFQNKNYKT